MNQKTVMIVLVTIVLTLMVAPRLRNLPGINKLPTV